MESSPCLSSAEPPSLHVIHYIEKGYRHLRLAPGIRDWFLLKYHGRYFRCLALPFGWGRSPIWTRLMAPFITELRRLGYRVLGYLDDFLIAPLTSRTRGITPGLRERYSRNRKADATSGAFEACFKGRVDRVTSCKPFGRSRRHESYEVLHPTTQYHEGAVSRPKASQRSSGWPAMGVGTGTTSFLRRVCFPHHGDAMGSILYPFALLGPVERKSGNSRETTLEPPSHQGPTEVARALQERAGWPLHGTFQARRFDAHRRRGPGIRWYTGLREHGSRKRWSLCSTSGLFDVCKRKHQLSTTVELASCQVLGVAWKGVA